MLRTHWSIYFQPRPHTWSCQHNSISSCGAWITWRFYNCKTKFYFVSSVLYYVIWVNIYFHSYYDILGQMSVNNLIITNCAVICTDNIHIANKVCSKFQFKFTDTRNGQRCAIVCHEMWLTFRTIEYPAMNLLIISRSDYFPVLFFS